MQAEATTASLVHIPCPGCQSLNRVQWAKLSDHPRCGRCKAPLFAEHPVALDDATFDRYISQSDLPVVVDFWAAWCGPCRAMAPQFEAAAKAHQGKVLFAKLDTDAAQRTAAKFDIRSIPTMVVFAGGRELARQSGAMSASQIGSWLGSALSPRR